MQRGDNHIDCGSQSKIYAISEKVVFKIYAAYFNRQQRSRQISEHELAVGQELYRQGVQVPEYYGLFSPVQDSGLAWGLFMERLEGVTPARFQIFSAKIDTVEKDRYLLYAEAERQYQEQTGKIESLGYQINDSSLHSNTLFNIQKKKLYFFDLEDWKKA